MQPGSPGPATSASQNFIREPPFGKTTKTQIRSLIFSLFAVLFMSDISNPEAPQDIKYDGGEHTDVKSLSNEDFKRFLQTPREPSRFSYTDPARNVPRTPRRDGSDFKKPKPKPLEAKKVGSKYRDRAAERRDGAEDEYTEGEEILRTIELEEDRETAIEHSKILGGDMENTHLVKGLDYALFHKKQREMEEEERLARAESARLQREGGGITNMAGRQIIATASGFQAVETVAEFKTELGKRVHRAIFTKSRPDSTESFLPGRTMFVYDLDPDMNLSIPTAVLHPKDEAIEQKDLIWCAIHSDLVSKLAQALVDARDEKTHRRSKRKERAEVKSSPQPSTQTLPKLASKISLFDDVDDDYDPSPQRGPGDATTTSSSPSTVEKVSSDVMEVDSPAIGPTKPGPDTEFGYPDPDSFEIPPKRPKIE
eukprot:TRINITY_DN207_c0_g1_i4.p1 TRINITY_DN207_c0_g1~~TRINITY_DN207_c0_g1_i4.p1  ORF type:complete len:425 (-),score=51.93 TRINITY_DN207_c0_g1_i4:142-1416(-)